MKVDFVTSDFKRGVANSVDLVLFNRYFEENPSLTEDGASLLTRPGLNYFTSCGEGPIRGLESESGSFDGHLIVASGTELYRVRQDGTSDLIGTDLSDDVRTPVNIAITANIEDTPAYAFVADGSTLRFYTDNGFAFGSLSGTASNGNVVRIMDMYYQFTSGAVDTGTPAGTSSNPWLVALGANNSEAMNNLSWAIGADGIGGTEYSSDTQANPVVTVQARYPEAFTIRASVPGATGNGIITTAAGSLVWTGATLEHGGEETFLPVPVPDDFGVIDVAVCNSFVIVIPAQGENINGRFYWIQPGETTIQELDFATAETAPDGINGVTVFGDNFWLSGDTTTEVWFFTGDPDTPVRRLQGMVFNNGTWADTAVSTDTGILLTDSNGAVWLINGNTPTRISSPAIEEQIREAIQYQESLGL